jgi:hypothetical protein
MSETNTSNVKRAQKLQYISESNGIDFLDYAYKYGILIKSLKLML